MIKNIREIFQSGPYQRMFKNTGLLVSGDTVSAVLGVLTFAVSARALGTQMLGMLVLIDAYVHMIDKLMNFQSWQFMIKFGSDALENKDKNGFKALVKFGTLVDGCTALLGTVVCIVLTGAIAKWQNWNSQMIPLTIIYSSAIMSNVSGVPTGVLRIFDQFKLFSVQKSLCATIKFVGAIIGWRLGYGLTGFLWTWLITELFDDFSLIWMGWRELHKQGYHGIWAEPLKGMRKKFPGLWNFMISTNLTGSVKVGFREFDILVVGKLLTLTDVSLYKLAKKLCASLDRLTNPLYQSLFPELTKAWAKRDYKTFKHLVFHMIVIMGVLAAGTWIGFFFFGNPIIRLTAGMPFMGAYWVTVWYLLANCIAITALPLSPMMLAMGKANLSFWIQFVPSLIYFPLLFWMINAWGLVGAGYAYVAYHGIRVFWQWFVIDTLFKKMTRPEPLTA